ncbi:EAL domain-containing protein [Synechococcus sp. RSCCF101]|uniref:EAL domain-containing protein n=1 Tax=Synechococcus sp. RSCCF101 TaxID=2511069 RepID=UPI001246A9D4|nr:EAL domain-containing protein [Synechococcus sp. RSCCF101]QEY32069.1 EAL domain-containing protein [Synechococcus sp. RSCCF101]
MALARRLRTALRDHPLLTGLAVVSGAMLVSLGITIQSQRQLAQLTENLHRHLFTVSRSVWGIRAAIVEMHRDMKDVVLAENDAAIRDRANSVYELEGRVFGLSDVIEERFLGDLDKITSLRKAFADWRPIRQEVIALSLAGKREAAAALTKGKGREYINSLLLEMNDVQEFAEQQAATFLADSKRVQRRVEQRTTLFIVFFFALLSVWLWLLLRSLMLLRLDSARTQALLTIPRLSEGEHEQDFLQDGLEVAESLTGSTIGFLHFVNEDGHSIELITWSRRTLSGYCHAVHDAHYPVAEAGIWADAIRQKRPVVVNDYAKASHRRGLPEGHAHLARFLTVPVIEDGRVVMIAGVGNKPSGYKQSDVETMQLLFNQIWRAVQRKRTMALLAETAKDLKISAVAFEHTADGVMITDASNAIIKVNQSFCRITGYSEAEALGQKPSFLKSDRHDDVFYGQMWNDLQRHDQWQGEIWNRRKDGSLFAELLTINVVRDSANTKTGYVAVFTDISSLKQSEAMLYDMAHTHPLTRLPNRLMLKKRLEESLKRADREGRKVAVMFMDLDHFKSINDSLGHEVGDIVLLAVSDRMKALFRANDTLAHFGGDEFVAVLESIPDSDAVQIVVKKILSLYRDPVEVDGHQLFLTSSIGVSLYPDDGTTSEVLLQHADAAMYKAKESGGNAHRFFSREMAEHSARHLACSNAIRQSIQQQELELLYQPQIDLASNRIAGVEVLVRWHGALSSSISTRDFIDIAEQNGMIEEIGRWVLGEACRQGRIWLDQGIDVGLVAVNIAGPQIQSGQLLEVIDSVVAETGFPTSHLELEVNEDFIMTHPEEQVHTLRALRERGLNLSIDDFGTAYSSLAQLKRLPIDRLKIDQSFVMALPSSREDLAIVESILALAKAMDLTTVAEGVEDEAQARCLRERGCTVGQGYYFARPLSAGDFLAFLRRWPNESPLPAPAAAAGAGHPPESPAP